MNKHQEALNRIVSNDYIYFDEEINGYRECKDTKRHDLRMIKELVDKVPHYEKMEAKATPMKPEMIPFNGFDADVASYLGCPKCDLAIVNVFSNREYKPNFCQHCGQRFDWSKDEQTY